MVGQLLANELERLRAVEAVKDAIQAQSNDRLVETRVLKKKLEHAVEALTDIKNLDSVYATHAVADLALTVIESIDEEDIK